MAHLADTERDAYLAGLQPGADVDHRGTFFTAQLLDELLDALRDRGTGQPHLGDALFGSATFEGYARFESATFEGYAGFGMATFEGYAGFEAATFKGKAWFWAVTFKHDAGFGSVTFEGSAGFWEVTFEGDAGFRSATFQGDAGFASATLDEVAAADVARPLGHRLGAGQELLGDERGERLRRALAADQVLEPHLSGLLGGAVGLVARLDVFA
ncbi:pentapeptide repeat-containing protein [Streptomyces sp. NPDC055140]